MIRVGGYTVDDKPRPIKQWERDLLLQMLSKPFPGRDELLQQAQHELLVKTEIADGTFGFFSYHEPQAKTIINSVPVAGHYESPNGVYVLFLLHLTNDGTMDGHFSEIEIVTVPDGQAIVDLDPEDIQVQIETRSRSEMEAEVLAHASLRLTPLQRVVWFLNRITLRLFGVSFVIGRRNDVRKERG